MNVAPHLPLHICSFSWPLKAQKRPLINDAKPLGLGKHSSTAWGSIAIWLGEASQRRKVWFKSRKIQSITEGS